MIDPQRWNPTYLLSQVHMTRFISATVLLLLMSAPPVRAQDAGQIGIVMKAQFIPQVGITWHVTNRLQIRLSGYGEGDGENIIDFGEAFIGNVAVFYRFPIDDDLASYVGPDFMRSTFTEETFLGLIFGSQYQLHKHFGVFGEVGFSVRVEDVIDNLRMFNTGAGVVFYLNE